MTVIATVRLVVHFLVLVLTLAVLGLSANWVAGADGSAAFADLGLAVSIITLLIVVPCRILDRMRSNAFLSWTAVELAWNGLLWVLWLAVAAYNTSLFSGLECSDYYYADLEGDCEQLRALMALPWIIWLLLLGLFIYLLAVGITQHSRGNTGIWTLSAAEASGGGPGGPSGAYAMAPANANQAVYAPPPSGYNTATPNPNQPNYGPAPSSGYNTTNPGTVYSGTSYQAGVGRYPSVAEV